MGERLSGGSIGLALLANTIATGATLAVDGTTWNRVSGGNSTRVQ